MGLIHQKMLFNSHYAKKQKYTNKTYTNEDHHARLGLGAHHTKAMAERWLARSGRP